MEIRDVIHVAAKWWLLILILTIASIVLAAIVSFYFLQNEYESSAVLIISSPRNNQDQSQLTLNDYTLNIMLVNSYRVLCKTDRILTQVISETKLPLTVKALSEKINVTAQGDTEIINITVQDPSPATAALLANAVALAFIKEVPQIMRMDNVQIIDKAYIPTMPVTPDRKMIIAVSALLGLLLGAVLAFLIEYFDVSVKSSEQLARLMEAPVMGTIPHLQERAR